MNARMKKRLFAVSGVIVIVFIAVLAFVGGNTAAQTVSVAEAAQLGDEGRKVQVSGNVVPDSFKTEDDVLSFQIYDPDAADGAVLSVRYDGAAASTFGNDVTAICTGRVGSDGVLKCSELVTKCPSKYESSETALSVSRLIEYGDGIVGKPVKVAGVVGEGSVVAAGQGDRFLLVGADGAESVAVAYDGALSEGVCAGARVVLTGSLDADGRFAATDVSLEG